MAETTCVLKLGDGADIMEGLQKIADEKGIDYGFLVSCSGRIKEFELLSTSSGGGVDKMKFVNPFEVNAISGKIQKQKGKLTSHIRVSVTSTGFTPLAGQLISGKAAGSFEISIRKVDMKKIIEA
ncbi:MAG: DNA-binding protein [Candidatus Diapherotrites archaeon]